MAVSVSLKTLAEMLGVAPSTVSRALKGHPDISRATQQRVRALAQELHYKPNALALGLRNKRSNLIAMLVPFLGNYFYACAVSSVVRSAYSFGYKVIVFENREDYEQEVGICQFLRKSGIDGLVVTPARTTDNLDHFAKLQNEGIPMVFFDRIAPNLDTDRILEDDYKGARAAVAHMLAGGCRKIAHIALPRHYLWAQKREKGYLQALKDWHLFADEQLIVECDDVAEICGITRQLVRCAGVDGIFAADDVYAVQVLGALRQMKYKVPEKVAVCGYGNDPSAGVVFPALTTVNKDGYRAGDIAAGLLIRRIESKDETPTETRLLESELIVRDSTLPAGR